MFNVSECVGRDTTALCWTQYGHMSVPHVLFFFMCCVKEMAVWLSLTKLSDMQLCESLCVCVCFMCVSECVDQWSSSLSGWALCFDFFSSSLRSNASPLSYAARTSLEGLQSLSPSTYETPPSLPFSPLLNSFLFPSFPSSYPSSSSSWLPVLICWSSPLCLTPLFMFESVMLRVRLGSTHQPPSGNSVLLFICL